MRLDCLAVLGGNGSQTTAITIAEGSRSYAERDMSKKALKESRKGMLCSISYRLAAEITAAGVETRVTVLGHVQRGRNPSGYDRILTTRFGAAAAVFAAENYYGVIAALQEGIIKPVPLSKIADKIKKVPKDHPMLLAAYDIGICFANTAY